jgi:phosphatidylserine/phosphatidylglycerophosphate/cardiolipin synthase-like enzyme
VSAPATTGPGLVVRTLTDGGQPAAEVAATIASFLSAARATLDLALYDFDLTPRVAAPVVEALRAAAARGVAVRMAVNRDKDPDRPINVPPPPRLDPDLLASTGVPVKPIPGIPDLMHHKYVIRDGGVVWTGSMNWTDDSFTREENVVVVATSPDLAAAYTHDFEDLWSSGDVGSSGGFEPELVRVEEGTVRAWFCPGRGRALAHRISEAIGNARRRVRVCSPVITAGPILGTLAETAARGTVDLAGVYDGTQMQEVLGQWADEPGAGWKIPAFHSLVLHAPFGGKASTPYGPNRIHDYMHAKVTVADDLVFVGSYNLSRSGQDNAENVLEIFDPDLAGRMAAFADSLRARYPGQPVRFD